MLHCLSPRRPGHRFWAHCAINLCVEGREQSWHSRLSTAAASTASRQRFPRSAAPTELGAKGTGGMSSLIHEEHLGQLPTWSCGGNEQQEQSDPAVRRLLGSSFHLRAPCWLCVVTVSLRPHGGGQDSGNPDQLQVLHWDTAPARRSCSPPWLRAWIRHRLPYPRVLPPILLFPHAVCPICCSRHQHQKELGKTSVEHSGIGPAHGRQRWGACTSSAHDFPTQESTREHWACP